jgi:hypothetical protein
MSDSRHHPGAAVGVRALEEALVRLGGELRHGGVREGAVDAGLAAREHLLDNLIVVAAAWLGALVVHLVKRTDGVADGVLTDADNGEVEVSPQLVERDDGHAIRCTVAVCFECTKGGLSILGVSVADHHFEILIEDVTEHVRRQDLVAPKMSLEQATILRVVTGVRALMEHFRVVMVRLTKIELTVCVDSGECLSKIEIVLVRVVFAF